MLPPPLLLGRLGSLQVLAPPAPPPPLPPDEDPPGFEYQLPALSSSSALFASSSTLFLFSSISRRSSSMSISSKGSENTRVEVTFTSRRGLSVLSQVGTPSMASSVLIPPTTLPNTVCFLSRWGALLNVK